MLTVPPMSYSLLLQFLPWPTTLTRSNPTSCTWQLSQPLLFHIFPPQLHIRLPHAHPTQSKCALQWQLQPFLWGEPGPHTGPWVLARCCFAQIDLPVPSGFSRSQAQADKSSASGGLQGKRKTEQRHLSLRLSLQGFLACMCTALPGKWYLGALQSEGD